MHKLKVFLMAVCLLFVACPLAFATVGVQQEGGTVNQATDINFTGLQGTVSSDGSVVTVPVGVASDDDVSVATVTATGTIQFQTSIYASGTNSGATTLETTVTPLAAANLAFSRVALAGGSPGNHMIADGSPGKIVTFQLLANPSYTIGDTLDSITKTGWETITLDTAYDLITLYWPDDTTGWIIVANEGCAITY